MMRFDMQTDGKSHVFSTFFFDTGSSILGCFFFGLLTSSRGINVSFIFSLARLAQFLRTALPPYQTLPFISTVPQLNSLRPMFRQDFSFFGPISFGCASVSLVFFYWRLTADNCCHTNQATAYFHNRLRRESLFAQFAFLLNPIHYTYIYSVFCLQGMLMPRPPKTE